MAPQVLPNAVLRVVLVALILAMPATVRSAETDSTGEVEIKIEVVPPGEAGEGSGVLRRTATAWIAGVSDALSGEGVAVHLIVSDARGTGDGWVIQLHTTPPEEAPLLDRYTHRTDVLAGQPLQGVTGPHGERLSVGQPLNQPVPVLAAKPGAGMGVYQVHFELGPVNATHPLPTTLILTLPSAP